MTVFKHKKTGKLYTIKHLCGGHRFLGKPYEATPYMWDGPVLGGFQKGRNGKNISLDDFEFAFKTNFNYNKV